MVIFHSYVSLPEGILCFGCFIGDFSQEKNTAWKTHQPPGITMKTLLEKNRMPPLVKKHRLWSCLIMFDLWVMVPLYPSVHIKIVWIYGCSYPQILISSIFWHPQRPSRAFWLGHCSSRDHRPAARKPGEDPMHSMGVFHGKIMG